MSEIQSENLMDLERELQYGGLKKIPKPFFISNLFIEYPFAICRPLDPPFDRFAVTHFGMVFQYKPFHTYPFGDDMKMIHPGAIVDIKQTKTDRNYIRLQDIRTGRWLNTYMDVLVSHKFFGTQFHPRAIVEHIDGNTLNDHYLNLNGTY